MWTTRNLGKGAVALLAVLAVTAPTHLPADAPEPEPTVVITQCELTIRPAEVQRVPEPVPLQVALSEEIGTIEDVSVQERSRVGVEAVETPSPAAVVVTIRTENAQEGEWTVTVTGTDGECSGTLTVRGGDGHPELR
jgi:hypothetical protein